MYNIEKIKNIYTGRESRPAGKHRFFSVLVPFVEKDGELNLLFEVRSSTIGSDPGEICFPGGHMEKGETPVEAALRETEEETGIPVSEIEVIGQGDTLYGYANYTLYTTMGIISYEAYKKAVIEKAEVEELFLVPLRRFEETEPEVYDQKIALQICDDFPYDKLGITKDYYWRQGPWAVPIYDVDNRLVWGLTARIVMQMMKVLEEEKNL